MIFQCGKVLVFGFSAGAHFGHHFASGRKRFRLRVAGLTGTLQIVLGKMRSAILGFAENIYMLQGCGAGFIAAAAIVLDHFEPSTREFLHE